MAERVGFEVPENPAALLLLQTPALPEFDSRFASTPHSAQLRGPRLATPQSIGRSFLASTTRSQGRIPRRLNSSVIWGRIAVAWAMSASPSAVRCVRSLSIPRPYSDEAFFGLILSDAL
jgi:hypothetical protein